MANGGQRQNLDTIFLMMPKVQIQKKILEKYYTVKKINNKNKSKKLFDRPSSCEEFSNSKK